MVDGLVIDRGFDSLARPNALAVLSIYSIGMTYDDASRLHTVTSGRTNGTNKRVIPDEQTGRTNGSFRDEQTGHSVNL